MKRRMIVLLLTAAVAGAEDKKISELPDGSPLQSGDLFPIARAGGNFRLAGSDFVPSPLQDGGTIPACDVTQRGKFWFDVGGTGVADAWAFCQKDSANAYAWAAPVPKEQVCSSTAFWGNAFCDFPPLYQSTDRTVTAPAWISGGGPSSLYSDVAFVSALGGSGYSGLNGQFTGLKLTNAWSGAQSAEVYGNYTQIVDESTGSSSGSSALYGGFFSVHNNSTAAGPASKYVLVLGGLGVLGNASTTRSMSAVNGTIYLGTANTAVVTDFAAAVSAQGPDALSKVGSDITKVYKFYAPATTYGRNYLGQPNDSGLYAAEVVGGKGLLAGGANGQIQFSDLGTRPTCDAAHRGSTWYDAGGAGVADTFEVCAKSSGDAYSWYALATIP